jgi:hypothetical protein
VTHKKPTASYRLRNWGE